MAVFTERPAAPVRPAERPPLGPTLALAVALAVGAAALAAALALIVIPPKTLPPPLPEQHQHAESLVYVLSFAAIVPAAVYAASRLAGAVGSALAGLLIASLPLAVLALRLADALGIGGGDRSVLVLALLWWAAAGAVLALAAHGRLRGLDRFAAPIWLAAGVLGLGALLCLTDLGSVSPVGIAVGAALVATARLVSLPRLPRRWGLAVDVLAVLAVLLAVPDLLIFRPESAVGNPNIALETSVIQFHHDFLLGPANEVLGGHPMLAETASQYGVTSIYLLVAWFLVAPIGYGTLGLFTAALTALWFAAGYGVLRLGRVSRGLAAVALALGVVVLVFNLSYPVGSLPQSTPLRFGLPMGVILALVAGERRRARARLAAGVAAGIVGLSAIWALEAFVYTVVVYAGLTCLQAWLERSARLLAVRAGAAAIAVVAAHVLFAALTLAVAGRLPDWGEYLAYLREFLFGELGDLTYDIPPWSPGYAVGIGYLASAAAVIELARRRRGIDRATLVALAGTTAYGIALFSYYVDRSLDHILLYVGLPALLTATLWASVLARARQALALAFVLAAGVLLLAVAWSAIGDRFPRSALAQAAPGGESLRGSLERLWHPPPMNATAPAGQRLVAGYMPGKDVVLMVAPDVGIEIMVRDGRHDRFELGDPWESSFVAARHLPRLRAAVDALRPGDRMLIDDNARRLLARFHADPSLNPLTVTPPLLSALQQWALKRIDARYRLRPVGPHDGPFAVVELVPRA
jgi:hypothetical protein